ncbi:MAG: substrate-binding domain-containing protein [Caldilineaceae bacterium]
MLRAKGVDGVVIIFPPLTTVRHPKAELGLFTISTLLTLIERGREITPQTITLPVKLIARASTAPPKASAVSKK